MIMCAITENSMKLWHDLTGSTLRKWCIVLGVLVGTHLVSAKIGYDRLNGNVIPGLTIQSSLKDWVKATWGNDYSTYLAVAQNFAAGRGLLADPTAWDPRSHPFCFWGPGTPFVLGEWLRLTKGSKVWSCFLFSAILQFIWGAIAVATGALFTRRTWALAATAFLTGCCPPLHDYFYSTSLTSSEIVALVPLGMMFFALSKAWLLRSKRNPCLSVCLMWFASAGVWLGLASLVRDSLSAFAGFTAICLLLATGLRNLKQIGSAIAIGSMFVVATEAVRYPVKLWNYQRVHVAAVSTSSAFAVWKTGLWSKHDSYIKYQESGIGFGEFLDPQAAQRVEAYYADQKPNPELYSFGQLVLAVIANPLKAIEFRGSRLPVLWLDVHDWPHYELTCAVLWCALFYSLFFWYLLARTKARLPIPTPLYLYPAFLVCASLLIHYEFRYSIPVWQMLVTLPAIWAAHLAECAQTLKSLYTSDSSNDSRTCVPSAQFRLPAMR
jgi:hypothetical protein